MDIRAIIKIPKEDLEDMATCVAQDLEGSSYFGRDAITKEMNQAIFNYIDNNFYTIMPHIRMQIAHITDPVIADIIEECINCGVYTDRTTLDFEGRCDDCAYEEDNQVCDSCGETFDENELNDGGYCQACAEEEND